MARQKQIVIHPPEIAFANFQLVALSPYLADGIPPGAIDGIVQPGKSKAKKVEAPIIEQTPEEEAASRVAWVNGKKPKDAVPGITGASFQKSMINACRRIPNLTMAEAQGLWFVQGHIIPMTYKKQELRPDIVRRPPGPRGTPAKIYRYAFHDWEVDMPLMYEASQISLEMLTHLLNYAGMTVGVGGWRPQKGGTFGRFQVAKVSVIEDE